MNRLCVRGVRLVTHKLLVSADDVGLELLATTLADKHMVLVCAGQEAS